MKLKRTITLLMVLLLLIGTIGLNFGIEPARSEPKTWTVDDDGPADFHTIQEAISAASDGDTIFVIHGIYREHVVINRTVALFGEEMETTVIDGGGSGTVVNVTAGNATVSEFTIRNSGPYSFPLCSGIYITHSLGNLVRRNNVTQNKGYGVYLEASNYTRIEDNIIASNGYSGIVLVDSCKNKITENMIADHQDGDGILLSSNFNDTEITGNTITNNTWGISLGGSLWTIHNNTIANNKGGIFMSGAAHNNISNNTVAFNQNCGLEIEQASPNNTFRHNTLYENGWNFGVFAGFISDFVQDLDPSNTVDGKPIYYWVNESDKQVPSDAGYVAAINSVNITVRDLSLKRSLQGVLFVSTVNSTIENVNVSNTWYGIHMILLSQNNAIRNNKIANNTWRGIDAYLGSSNNTVNGNRITSTRAPYTSSAPWYMQFGFEPRLAIGIYMGLASDNCQLQDNDVIDNQVGFYIETSHNVIKDNSIVSNVGGVGLSSRALDNTFFHNTVASNWEQASSYHPNTWDNGYPSGGNYWSDYEGADKYRGPGQNITGSDGIGDTPYVINSGNRDNYPLMSPRLKHDLAVQLQAPTSLGPGESSWLTATVSNFGRGSETDVNLLLQVDGNTVGSKVIPFMQNGSSYSLSYFWTPLAKGTHNVTACVVPKETEVYFENNQASKLVPFFKYAHDIKVTLDGPSGTVPYTPWIFNGTVYNIGSNNETNLQLKMLINGTTVDSINIPELLSNSSQAFNCSLTPPAEGNYNVTASIVSPAGEIDLSDNAQSLTLTTHSAVVRFEPQAKSAEVGETFTVNITIADTIDLYHCDVELYYPNDALEAIEIVLGNFPNWCWAQHGNHPYYNATHGCVEVNLRTCAGTPGVNGTGVVATIRFRAIEEGSCILSLNRSATRIQDSSERSMWLSAENGYVKVEGLLGDLNGDRAVNILDISIVAKAFGCKPGDPHWNPVADMDLNGIVNIVDVSKVAKEFGKELKDRT